MKHWDLDLVGNWSAHVFENGELWLLGPNGEDFELDPYIHAKLYLKVMKLGKESRDAELIELADYKRRKEGERHER